MTESEKRDAAFEAWWCSPEAKKITQHADRRAAEIGFQAAYALLAPEMRDAARYRWIKANADVTFHHEQEWPISNDQTIYSTMPAANQLDTAVDAAIAAMETKHATE